MIGTLFLLNTEAGSESGFGFNFDIIETNLINLGIVFVLLIVYGGKVVGNILSERRAKIESEIKAAEARAKESKDALALAQKNLKEAQDTADLNSEQERAIAQLRERVVAMALEQAESRMGDVLDDDKQRQLIDRSIAQLGG